MTDGRFAGRARSPGSVALLGLIPLGLGFAWYYFQAFREVDLDVGRRHSPMFFLAFLPFLGPIFGLLYVAVELRTVQAARLALGLGPGIGAGQHFLLLVMGGLVGLGAAAALFFPLHGAIGDDAWIPAALLAAWLTPVFAAPMLAPTVNGYWEAREQGAPPPSLPRQGPPAPSPSP